jgi:nicotinate-nucleotide adenylyltransferase
MVDAEKQKSPGLKRIGVFGGTFDPIHHGHLILAREARETLGLDTMIFIPAAVSPHKLDQKMASGETRLEMLRVALDREPGFEYNTMELQRSPPSFTIDTVEALQSVHPKAEFFYLIWDDNLGRLPSWHRFEELSRMVRFIVLNRTGAKTPHGYPMIHRHLDISATNIRNRVATGRSIRYLVPPAVEEIIRDRQLYRESKQ